MRLPQTAPKERRQASWRRVSLEDQVTEVVTKSLLKEASEQRSRYGRVVV